MSFLDKMAMKQALKRLQEDGVAPSDATPIDYDSAAFPGSALGSGILLLTNEAIYFGIHGSRKARRIPLSDIGRTAIVGNVYSVLDKTNNEVIRLEIRSPRSSFQAHFLVLGK